MRRVRVYDAAMEVIYIDRLFLLNGVIDYLLCLVSARVCGLYLKRLRYALAALLGALYAVAALLPGFAFLSSPLWKLVSAALMALIAYGEEKHALRCGGVFLLVSATFGGAVWALSLSGGGSGAAVSGRVLILSFALCYAGVSLLFRRAGKLPTKPRAEVTLRFLGREACFMALRDTGNSLTDPLTGCEVMLVSPHALRAVMPGAASLFEESDPVGALEALSGFPELEGRFRIIPYTAVGTAGLLPVFRPERVTVDGKEEKELLAAVSPSAAGDGFEAIV